MQGRIRAGEPIAIGNIDTDRRVNVDFDRGKQLRGTGNREAFCDLGRRSELLHTSPGSMAENDDGSLSTGMREALQPTFDHSSGEKPGGRVMARLVLITAVLGIAIGLPYFASQPSGTNPSPGISTPLATSPPDPLAANETPPPAVPGLEPANAPIQSPGSLIYASPAPLEGSRLHAVEHVLRFDVTKDWVYRNWARKSTGPTDVGLFAVRVPLVTGTHVGALAGSLTYYFNSSGQVEHISFRGRTGDTTQLVNFFARTYEFQRADAPAGEQCYQVKRGRRIQSELRTRPEPVLWATLPHTSIAVELELARPGTKRVLPPRGPALDIPQAASAATAASTASQDASPGSPGGSYLDNMRYATPQEEGQVLWKRWPN